MQKKFDALLFDLDGTLVDSREDLSSAVNHVLKTMGHLPQSMEQIVPKIGNGLRKLLTDTLGIDDKTVLDKAKIIFDQFYYEHCLDKTKVYKDVSLVLDLFSKEFKMAVVTNKPERYTEKILRKLDLEKFFSVVIGGDTLKFTKPDPAPIQEALIRLKVGSDRSIMIGDGIQDILSSRAAGVEMCLVQYGFGFSEGLLMNRPQFSVKDFISLKEIVL